MNTEFWSENLEARDHLQWIDNIKMYVEEKFWSENLEARDHLQWEDNIKMHVEETRCDCKRHSSESKYGKEGSLG